MRRLLLSGLAGIAVLVAAMDPADARGGNRDGGRHFSRGGGHGGGWGRGALGLGLGIGIGSGLAYRGGWGGYYSGYGDSYPYAYSVLPPLDYYQPAYPEPIYPEPALAPPGLVVQQAPQLVPQLARMCRAAMQVSCRLQQPTQVGAGCGCVSNMGMLPGYAGP